MQKKMLTIMHYLFRWGGLAGMAFAMYALADNTLFFFRADTATGTVLRQTAMKAHRTNVWSETAYAPFISFKTKDGQAFTFLSNVGYGKQFAFHDGDEVPVIYRPDDPESAKIYSLFELFGLPVVLFVFGGVFWLCGIFVQFIAEHKGKDPNERRSRVNV